MARGVWIHQDRQGNRDRATAYTKARCNHANTYCGYSDTTKQIDTRCARCGRRVRFNAIQKKGDRRGKVRQALFLSMPKATFQEIKERADELNRVDPSSRKRGGGGETFVTALKLMSEKTTPPVGVPLNLSSKYSAEGQEVPAWKMKGWRELNERMLELGMKGITLEDFLNTQR